MELICAFLSVLILHVDLKEGMSTWSLSVLLFFAVLLSRSGGGICRHGAYLDPFNVHYLWTQNFYLNPILIFYNIVREHIF